jgi:hypothetical protein
MLKYGTTYLFWRNHTAKTRATQFYYKPSLGYYRTFYVLPEKRRLGRFKLPGTAYKHLFKGWEHAIAQIENKGMELNNNATGYN